MANSHYVPMLSLRRFTDNERLCVYNVKTKEYNENVKISKVFSTADGYSDEVEEKLNKKIESQFGNLFVNKLLNADGKIELNRDELKLIKKFLLISVIRSHGNEEFMQKEKRFYEDLNKFNELYATATSQEFTEIKPPFEEKQIEGETPFDYWMRTMEVILDSDGSPENIIENPRATYPAHRWADVIKSGYLAFWDADYEKEEFIITDIGMTSENELGWNGMTIHNKKKIDYLMWLFQNIKNQNFKNELLNTMCGVKQFHENFQMFPISSKRMIVEISPFYKFRIANKGLPGMLNLEELTKIPNEKLFYPNDVKYVYEQKIGKPRKFHPNDKYVYNISKLTREETCYCNALFFDRIDTWVGFSSLKKVIGSLCLYKKLNSFPYIPRVDYTGLYKIASDKGYALYDDIGGNNNDNI